MAHHPSPSDDRAANPPRGLKNGLALAGFLLLSFIASGIGGGVTGPNIETWYDGLVKPVFNPPDWVFAPVWTALFIAMAVAAWRVWRVRGFSGAPLAFALYFLQLGLNVMWSVLFFGLRSPGLALVEILVLWAAIFATMRIFFTIDRAAGWLFAPYLAWVSYAILLNTSIWVMN